MNIKPQYANDGSLDELLVWNNEGTKHHIYTHRKTGEVVVDCWTSLEKFATMEEAFKFIFTPSEKR